MNTNNMIAGPSSAETREQTLDTARELCNLGYMNLLMNFKSFIRKILGRK